MNRSQIIGSATMVLTPSVIDDGVDASTQPSRTPDSNELNTDIPLTPETSTPTTETSTTAKINKNWWWALAAGALAYKLSRHQII